MARVSIWGDFKVNNVSGLKLCNELQKLINTCDINIVNFEAPVKTNGNPIPKSGPNISQDVNAPQWLEDNGFTAVSLANNHTMDYGNEGLDITKNKFIKAKVLGAGTWDEAYKVHVFHSIDGLKIGVLCFTHCEFGVLTDKFECKTKGIKGCSWALSVDVSNLIIKNSKEVDFLIVIPHGGIEYISQPLPEWREVYKHYIDLGADAVIASHPHVPQGYECYKEKPICYSLGNFCFDSSKQCHPIRWYEGLCCELEITSSHNSILNIIPIKYEINKKSIELNESKDFENYMISTNKILHNDKEYYEVINREVSNLYNHYKGMFSRGGFITGIFQKEFMKGFVEGLMGKGFWHINHVLNNIQCESHRWAILRAIELKQRKKS